jgi:hypothetical protein
MDAAQTIRDAVTRVVSLRSDAAENPVLHAATVAIKSFQARRFAGTYADLLNSLEYGPAARFFLEDLYSDKDYSLRDAQFARIAGGLQRIFPRQVVLTAVSLARLHVMTEELDRKMAETWIALESEFDEASKYAACWRTINSASERELQLKMVLEIGFELDRLTRVPGLRLMLRMMRRPASAAGIESLQAFLESGFDIFAHMSGRGAGARTFLATIRDRESLWIELLSGTEALAAETALTDCLARVHYPN